MTSEELGEGFIKGTIKLTYLLKYSPGLTKRQIINSFENSKEKKNLSLAILYQAIHLGFIEERGWFIKRYYYLPKNKATND